MTVVFRKLVVVTAVLAVCGLRAGDAEFRLHELLDRHWKNALVDKTFTAAPGTCHPDSVRLTGPHGEKLPAQLSQVELYPNTHFVKSARISWLATLPPRQTLTWTLSYGPEALPPPGPAGLGLSAKQTDKEIVIVNRYQQLILTAGETIYPDPKPAAEVPGPIRDIRFGEDMSIGGSHLYGPTRITAYRAELTAAGPVFAAARFVYTYEDDREMTLTVRLSADDRRSYWDMFVSPHNLDEAMQLLHLPGFKEGETLARKYIPADGWRLDLTANIPDLRIHTKAEFGSHNRWGKRVYEDGKWKMQEVDAPLAHEPPGKIVHLVPWQDWWQATTRTDWIFNTAASGSVFAWLAQEAGEWVEPARGGEWITWGNPRQRQKWAHVVHLEQGRVAAEWNLASGWRHWVFENRRDGAVKEPTLNRLSHMVVDWPADPDVRYPHLYITPEQLTEIQGRGGPDAELLRSLQPRVSRIQQQVHGSDADALGLYLLDGSPEMAEQMQVVQRLQKCLDKMGNYDTMRYSGLICSFYDALMGTDLISPAKKAEFRAKMAYLAYHLASPANWSMQRGYCSGNENMSVSHVLNQGTVACLLRDHPMAEKWVQPALEMTDFWLRDYVGPNGGWPESVSNYAYVSVSHLMPFAIAARNSGFHDYVNDIDMKRLALYLSKQYTPPDPRGGGQRKAGYKALPPIGRAGAGGRWGLDGLMAFATRDSDPKLSRQLQWSWLGTGQTRDGLSGKTGGFEYVILDPALPYEIPNWTYDVFPDVGAIMRHGIGTEDVWYLNFVANYSFVYMGENQAFATIFAKGAPISARFAGGYAEREETLISRVLPASAPQTNEERYKSFYHDTRCRVLTTAALPRQDYLEAFSTSLEPRQVPFFRGHNHPVEAPPWPPVEKVAEPGAPVHWRRQALFVKDADPGKTCYLVLRDTVSGGQPTMWQWWAVSDKIGTPDEASNLDVFLADAPGNSISPPRELTGNRFTAVGRFNVDTEFYVAAPTDTPRYTLRYGREYHYSPIHMWNEYMDMLHLQRTDDGAYFVVILPRRRNEKTPAFATLADGYVVKVSGEFGKDYVFLSPKPRTVSVDGITFAGTAASVQKRPDGQVLTLSAPGRVACGDYAVELDQPCSLLVRDGDLRIHFPDGSPGGFVTFQAPGAWTLDTGQGTQIHQEGQTFGIKFMQDVRELRLFPR